MSALRGKTGLAIIWLCLVGGYAAVSLVLRPGAQLTAFADVAQCVVLLFANAGLLLNAASPDWRRNSFWMLLGMGCGMWFAGQLLWTYFEVLQHQPVPQPFLGDVIFFLHTVPLLGALALRPHAPRADRNLRFGHVDFQLLLSWWVYLYLFIVIPWQYVAPDVDRYGLSYNRLYSFENFTLVAVLAYLVLRTAGPWRRVYAHLAGAACTYALGSMIINSAIDRGSYTSGSLYDIPLVASFVWFGVTGIIARDVCPPAAPDTHAEEESSEMPEENVWPARMAMTAALSLPALALWSELESSAPPEVRRFRLLTTLVALVVLSSLIFLRQRLVDEDRLRLLRASKNALVNLRRIQSQFVQAEKLASVGQLAAGAAHEINNPLTAILGYSDVLLQLPEVPERGRDVAQKIREQARRTKDVVGKLLTFAQPQTSELTLLDINAVVASVAELRRLDLRHKNIELELEMEKHLPGVHGDANQLLQVFFNIIANAVDAMEEAGGGLLKVRTLRDRRNNVVIEFSDTGPGIREPGSAFDPFYTTKPVGKGTGLGLSICYGLVKEHKGEITCANRLGGGAVFRIELPAIRALLPLRDSSSTPIPISTRPS